MYKAQWDVKQGTVAYKAPMICSRLSSDFTSFHSSPYSLLSYHIGTMYPFLGNSELSSFISVLTSAWTLLGQQGAWPASSHLSGLNSNTTCSGRPSMTLLPKVVLFHHSWSENLTYLFCST